MLAESPPDAVKLAWPRLANRTELPGPEGEFLAVGGAAPTNGDSRRRYHRFHLREKAVLRCNGESFAVYAKDISRMGLGLMAPMQLFPCDEIEILLPEQQWISLIVRRCRRIQGHCYDVGAEYAAGILNAGHYKELIQQVRLS